MIQIINFYSVMFLAVSRQNPPKQFTCVLIFKIVILTAAAVPKPGCFDMAW